MVVSTKVNLVITWMKIIMFALRAGDLVALAHTRQIVRHITVAIKRLAEAAHFAADV